MKQKKENPSPKKSQRTILLLVMSALFAALITVSTAFINVKTGFDEGYLHFGDSMIYLASCVLPLPYAMAASAIGGFLADILAGVPMWAPYTAIIKAFNAVPFAVLFLMRRYPHKERILSWQTVLMSVLSGLVTFVGYFFATWTMLGKAAALVGLPTSWIQPLGSAIVFYIVAAALDAAKFKKRVKKFL